MKNIDPKVMMGVLVTVIVLCILIVAKTLGLGGSSAPPPIVTGSPSGASLTLPAPPAGANGGGVSGGSAAPGGSMTLPTPPSGNR